MARKQSASVVSKNCRVQLFLFFTRNNCTKRPILCNCRAFFGATVADRPLKPKIKGVVSKCHSFFGVFDLISQKNHSKRHSAL